MQIHPSHYPEARRTFMISGFLLVVLVLCVLTLRPRESSGSLALSWHIVFEVLSVSVAAMIYGLVCSLRKEQPALNLILLASLFLGVGALDLFHMLSLQGMPDFLGTTGHSNKGIYFWLLGRLLAALALLCVAFIPWRITGSSTLLFLSSVVVLAAVAGATCVYVRHPTILPAFFLQDQGLSSFKVTAEYVLMALYGLAALRLYFHLKDARAFNVSGLLAAAFIMMLSEYFFTRYSDVTDTWMFVGHVYKVLAFFFLYYAVFVETVQRPYAQLRQSRGELLATFQALPDWVLELDAQGDCREFFQAAGAPGLPASYRRPLGHSLDEVMSASDAMTVREALREARDQGVSRGRLIQMRVGPQDRSFELSVARRPDTEAGEERFIVISRDVTERLQSEAALALLQSGIMQSPLPFVVTDTQYRIQLCNPSYAALFGHASEDLMGKRTFELAVPKPPIQAWRDMKRARAQGLPWQGELVCELADGQEHVVSVLLYPVRNPAEEITGYMAHVEDITEQRRAVERIRTLSLYDQLTGLPNLTLMQERFTASRCGHPQMALIWVDLDQFKNVNDTLGHEAGNQLLVAVARRLHAGLQGHDMLVRVSGDDFLLLVHDIDHRQAMNKARALQKVLRQPPIEVAGQAISLTLSIGIALCPEDSTEFDGLRSQAEAAMNRAKRQGHNHISFFTSEMQEQSARQLALGGSLRHAIERGQLRLVYQPVMALADHRVVGAEALLRWESDWGNVPPDEFIPIAEATGLIISMGRWVLQTAVQQLAHWRAAGFTDLNVAINFSAIQFQQGEFPQWVRESLAHHQVPASCLTLELTEAAAMRTSTFISNQVDELAQMGVRLAIDDFGTGYSSLSYLKQLPFHALKIDRSFVRNLETDVDDKVIASTIIRMAQSLGMRTIAEGVETPTQLAFMHLHGCDMVQGYYFSPPLAPDAFEAFIRTSHGGAAGSLREP